jgi:hypothetical protein
MGLAEAAMANELKECGVPDAGAFLSVQGRRFPAEQILEEAFHETKTFST